MSAEAEDRWVEEIVSTHVDASSVMAACTPSRINNEGHPEAMSPRSGNYGRGRGDLFAYRDRVRAWLATGDLEGLELDAPVAAPMTTQPEPAGRGRHRRWRWHRRGHRRGAGADRPRRRDRGPARHARRCGAAGDRRADHRRADRRRRWHGPGVGALGDRRRRRASAVRRARRRARSARRGGERGRHHPARRPSRRAARRTGSPSSACTSTATATSSRRPCRSWRGRATDGSSASRPGPAGDRRTPAPTAAPSGRSPPSPGSSAAPCRPGSRSTPCPRSPPPGWSRPHSPVCSSERGGSGSSATGGLSLGSMPGPERLGPIGAHLAGEDFAWSSGRIVFASGAEVAVVEPPRLLEVVRTEGVGRSGRRARRRRPRRPGAGGSGPGDERRHQPPVPGGLRRAGRRRCRQRSGRSPSCPTVPTSPPRCGPWSSPEVGRSARCRSIACTPGFAGCAEALAAIGPIDGVVVALSGAAPAGSGDGWERVLAEHDGIVGQIHTDAAWTRAVVDSGTPTRLVTVTDASTAGGRSRAQASAQLTRAARKATEERVAAFAVSLESASPAAHRSAAELVGHLLASPDAVELSGAELVATDGWLGLRSHPRAGGSITYGGPDVPAWLDDALQALTGPSSDDRPAARCPRVSRNIRADSRTSVSRNSWAAGSSRFAKHSCRNACIRVAKPAGRRVDDTWPDDRRRGWTGAAMTTRPTRIVDAHVHLWDPARTDWYPYLGGQQDIGMGDVTGMARRFDVATYRAEAGGLERREAGERGRGDRPALGRRDAGDGRSDGRPARRHHRRSPRRRPGGGHRRHRPSDGGVPLPRRPADGRAARLGAAGRGARAPRPNGV